MSITTPPFHPKRKRLIKSNKDRLKQLTDAAGLRPHLGELFLSELKALHAKNKLTPNDKRHYERAKLLKLI